jgi:hypothetical protein
MSIIAVQGNASGSGTVTVAAPNTNSNQTITLPDATGTLVLSGTTPTFNGIAFPATQSASSDANTLDDYEEGTWTPNDASGASLSFTGIVATYTKIGRQVTCAFTLQYPSTASSAVASIGGLPFTVQNPGDAIYGGYVVYTGYSIAPIQLLCSGGGTNISFWTGGNNNSPTNLGMSGRIIRAVVIYFV